jgi:RNA polymerase sigma-70 factor (ECF subfamily)
VERRQQTQMLEKALYKLPVEKRELLVMARYEEMKYEQIAKVLGCEVGAVKVRVHRALKDLRDIYLRLTGEKTSWPTNSTSVKKSETSLRII